MNELFPQRLILCAGVRTKLECAQAIEYFQETQPLDYWFIMSEWVDDDQYNGATLLWVVDDSEPWDAVRLALSKRVPLLVPEDNEPMRQVCVSASCGIFYRGASEARICLEFLLTNETIRRQLGTNGHACLGDLF
jgi:hypothetical protein